MNTAGSSPRIGIIRSGGLGDFLVTLPALGMLRTQWPQARITLIGRPGWAELGLNRHYLDEVVPIDGPVLAPFYSESGPTAAQWQEGPLATADIILNITPFPEDVLTSRLRQPAGPTRQVLEIDSRLTGHPASRQLCQALQALGLAMPATFQPRLFLREEDGREAEGVPRPFWILHPGSGSPAKNWPLESWSRLLEASRDVQPTLILLLLGETEHEAMSASELEGFLSRHPNCQPVIQSHLPKLAALLQRTSLYLGNDSGISHLAAAAGAPSIVLFGPSDPEVWAPQGPKTTILRAPGRDMKTLAPESVLEVLFLKL